jgi:hypothetical protein
MTFVDEITEAKCGPEWIAWIDKVVGSVDEIARFVTRRRGGGNVKRIVQYYRGFFNICICISFKDENPDSTIRFPKTGVTAFKDEKVVKEVQVMKFLRRNTKNSPSPPPP